MTFPVSSKPDPNDVFADSQLDIKTNFDSIIGWGQVDHVAYGAVNAGTHKKISLATVSAPAAPVGEAHIVNTKLGIADATSSNLFAQNKNVSTQINAIRSWAYVPNPGATAIGADIPITQLVNVTKVTRTAVGVYTVTMPANTVSSADYAVFATSENDNVPGGRNFIGPFTLTATTFEIRVKTNTGAPTDIGFFSFQVLQV